MLCCVFCLVAAKLKGVDLDAPGNINGAPVLEVDMESFEEKPWRKPGLCLFETHFYEVWCSLHLCSPTSLNTLFLLCVCVQARICRTISTTASMKTRGRLTVKNRRGCVWV